MKPKLIVVEGTNASGKSGLGVELALRYGGEIVSADSRQVFRGLDLGSGKITPEEMRGVPHHLVDVVEPNDFFSMRDFQRLAYEAIDGILAHNRAFVERRAYEGYELSDTPPDLAYREELEKRKTPELYRMLCELRPDVEVDPKNRNRVMRMLEKIHDGDEHAAPNRPRYDCLKLGVTWDRATLRSRIDERLKRRLDQGMVDEVRRLMEDGATPEFLMKLGLEYRFIARYLMGEAGGYQQMVDGLATAIKQFAKRQTTWFRRDPEILWLDMAGDPVAQASAAIERFLKER